jgi:iron complex transport system ATP-binding protein
MSVLQLDAAGVKGAGCWRIRNVSFTLRSGSITALIGPNGSGKSTCLRTLAGLLVPDEGRAALDGADLRSFSRRAVARLVAYVPQDTHLNFAFTVEDVVAMGRHPHLGRFQREGDYDRRCVADALARTDAQHLAKRLVTELSGGERQRIVIARSLATEARVILLDEPTANLDVAHALDTLALCQTLAREGRTIAVALHDLNAAARFADTLAVMAGGEIAAFGPSEVVFAEGRLDSVFGVRTERVLSSTGETSYVFHRRLK